MKLLTRKQLLQRGGDDGCGNKVHSTAWYIKPCNGFKVALSSDKKDWTGPFGSSDSLVEMIRFVESKYPDITFEIVPIEYGKDFKPRELTKLLIIEEFF